MGRPDLEDSAQYGFDNLLQATLSAFPSPTNPLDTVKSPLLGHTSTHTVSCSEQPTPYDGPLDIGAVSIMPKEVKFEQVMCSQTPVPNVILLWQMSKNMLRAIIHSWNWLLSHNPSIKSH